MRGFHARASETLPSGNVVSARVMLEHGSASAIASAFSGLEGMLSGPDHASLRRAFVDWIRGLAARGGSGSDLAKALRAASKKRGLRAMGRSFAERVEEFAAERSALAAAEALKQGLEQGLERGLEQGLERGVERGLEQGLEREREMLRRQAARRFGAGVGQRLASVLREVGDAERLAEIGEELIDCADGEALLARARGAAGRD